MESLFNVGDRIVYINGSGQMDHVRLIEGKSYTALEIQACSCGHIVVHVGKSTERNSIQKCVSCGGVIICWGKLWHSQTRFIKPETDQALEDEIRESLNQNIKI